MQELFFELIQVAIGRRAYLSHTPEVKEWEMLYHMAENQAVLGVCFAGVKRLQEFDNSVPMSLYMQWLAMAAKIQQRNGDMDQKTAEVWALLNKAGLDCAVLKGQGIAKLYRIRNEELGIRNNSLGMLRQSGDIDVWVKGGFDLVNDFVQKTRPSDDISSLMRLC